MKEMDITAIKKKSVAGVVALTSRTFILQVIAFGATILLTIYLTPDVFGIFYVVSAIISFLNYFSDIGLAASLIQKKEEILEEDLATTFTIQEALVVFVVLLSFLLSQPIAQYYQLDESGVWLFRALIVSFFLSSLKTIPSVLLERKLAFGKLIIPQVIETLSFYIVAVTLAGLGYGITSFTWAVLARSVTGLVALYIVSPWRIRIGFQLGVAKKLLKFGVPFQLNSFLALVKDDLLTVFLGKILPFAEVGYIGWAKKWAEIPLRLIMDSVVRVSFPAFSRLQHSRELLGKAIDKAIFGLSISIFPMSIGLLFFVKPLILIVPRYGKWEPALFSFYIFTLASAIASLSTPLTNALNAIGKIKTTLWLMVLWTTVTWILTVYLVSILGFNGVSLSLFIITMTIGIVVFLVKKFADFSFINSIRSACIGCSIQAGLYYVLLHNIQSFSLPIIVIESFMGVILYGLVIWILEKRRIKALIVNFRGT